MVMRLIFLNLSIFALCSKKIHINISRVLSTSFKELQISFLKAFNHTKFYRSSYFAFNDLSSSILWRKYTNLQYIHAVYYSAATKTTLMK